MRVRPGLTLHETLDHLNAGFDADADADADLPPLRLTTAQRAAWERIVDRVAREAGPVASEEYPSSPTLETTGPPGRIQLDHRADTADIEVAYRHSGRAARDLMERACRVARIVEDESGLTGYDFEVDQPTRTGDPARAAARLAGVSDWPGTTWARTADNGRSPNSPPCGGRIRGRAGR
ncbi:hypothetical protein [Streptomyces sp. JB150]|uniref:hypothetical protein n=1 Tax=Streptomyces sp. JB150 TaxID=2714844 RepID=UPI0019D31FAA|nr:hypothetical protein [Streptomyces sp. JB150]